MTLSRGRRQSLAPVLLGLTMACATGQRGSMSSDTGLRPATDVPTTFTFTMPPAGDSCRNPAIDPRDGARLTLVRSGDGRGDYAVPDGRYGAGPKDLLRIACATGSVVGLVPR